MNPSRLGRVGTGLAAATALVLGLSACTGPVVPRAEATQLTVLAAASLTDVMPRLADAYAQEQPDTEITMSFGGSQALVQQLQAGSPGDVLIAADEQALANLSGSARDAPGYRIVATNQLVLAVAPGNPGNITGLSDALTSQRIAVCAPAVPCGRAAQRVLTAAGADLQGASQENDVRSVLTKVSTGQVDAGFVYATDAAAAQAQGVTSIPLEDPSPNRYPALVTADPARQSVHRAAMAFSSWLSGPRAQQIFSDAGFGAGASGETPLPTLSAEAARRAKP